MKKFIISIRLVLILFLFNACSKDLGNYEYQDINEVSIEGINSSYTVIFKNDTLKIDPELSFTLDTQDPDRYSYEWKLVKGTPISAAEWKGEVLGTDLNLNYPVITTLPGRYSLFFKVTDNETSITWAARTAVEVTVGTAVGFLLMGEDSDGYAEVEMISFSRGDTLIIQGLLNDNGMPRLKGAVNIFHTGNGNSSVNNAAKIWIAGSERGYYLNTQTFQSSEMQVFKNMAFSSYPLPVNIHPIDYAPKTTVYSGTVIGSQRVILTNTGDLFTAGIISGDVYSNPINRLNTTVGSPLLKLSPYLLHGGTFSLSAYVVYDRDNHRFLRTSSATATNLTALADNAGDVFPWVQPEGRTLVYAENTKNTDGGSANGNSFALMKDQENSYFIYKFYAFGVPVKRNGYTVNPTYSAELSKSSLFAFASRRTAMYFAIDSRLYAYDYNTGNERIVLIKDFGEEITMLKSDIQASSTSLDLYVATYSESTKGTIHKMVLQDNTNTIELKKDDSVVWTGLSKIKAMSWRNSIY